MNAACDCTNRKHNRTPSDHANRALKFTEINANQSEINEMKKKFLRTTLFAHFRFSLVCGLGFSNFVGTMIFLLQSTKIQFQLAHSIFLFQMSDSLGWQWIRSYFDEILRLSFFRWRNTRILDWMCLILVNFTLKYVWLWVSIIPMGNQEVVTEK